MLVNGIPNFGHPGACGIHHFDILFVKIVHLFVRSSKRGQNHDIPFLNRFKVLFAVSHLFNELHIHFVQLVIDLGVVNQFVGNVNFAVGEMIHRLVGQSNGTFDAPAKAKILGQIHLDTILVHHVIARSQILDQGRFVLFDHASFHLISNFLESLAMKLIRLHHAKTIFLFAGGLFVLFDFGRLVQHQTIIVVGCSWTKGHG
mmetsp:Transcript_1920/g.5287  ORF Transcript_1920/g.5287 Transcript_1920/m.5287 type:complete len:202 (-) Transcript_1920:243-848(-)